ncbi:MAG: hypothetical protein M3Y56_03750 [Armatimonadota bacterium]|nr:hypothetical protein [Armatimonadota bacterium]
MYEEQVICHDDCTIGTGSGSDEQVSATTNDLRGVPGVGDDVIPAEWVDGKYEVAPTPGGSYHSHVLPGCWIKVDWLRQDPLPNTKAVAREWGLM